MTLRTLRDRQLVLALLVLFLTMATTVTHAAASMRRAGPGVVNDAQRQALRAPLRQTLVVPAVTRSAFVFAKMALSDAGFSWRVRGPVPGFASSVVLSQSPAPGTRVVDTGAPIITLHLRANHGYPAVGAPENTPPYRGTRIVLAR